MEFDDLGARGQISAAAMRMLARKAHRALPMMGGSGSPGTSTVTTSNGTASTAPGNDIFLAEITAVTGTGTSATYSFTEQTAPPTAGGTEDRTSGRTADKDRNAARYVGTGTLAVGDVVLARRHLANVNAYEILTLAGDGSDATDVADPNTLRGIVRGKLDGALNQGSSATMSVWEWDGSTDADTGENLTVYAWKLASGQSVAAGAEIDCYWDTASQRWYLNGAECA